jgi:hypothetical protein
MPKKPRKADDGLRPLRAVAGKSALQAYREDLTDGVVQPHDGALITIATLLHQAGYAAESDEIRDAWLTEVVKRARDLLGQDRLGEGQIVGIGPARTPLAAILLFAEFVEDCGRMRLAGVILNGSWALVQTRRDHTEVLLNCSRNERMLGNFDLALEQARRAYEMATEDGEDDAFRAVALSKLIQCVRSKGDLPQARELIKLHTELCFASKMPNLIANAHLHVAGMFTYLAENDRARDAFWEAYKVTTDWRVRVVAGINLAHVMFDAGYPREAKALAAATMAQPIQPRYALTSLAAYALSSGVLGELEDVEWAYGQVTTMPGAKSIAREYVVGLNACGEAFEWLGDPRSESILAEARQLMDRYGINDLKFRKELLELQARMRERRRQPANPVAEAIRREESSRPERVSVLV